MSIWSRNSLTTPKRRKLEGLHVQVQVPRSEGDGGSDGIILPMDMVGDGTYDVVYTVPIQVGDNQNLSVQVDIGSSDLWIASISCSSSACGDTNGRLYNPNSATSTGKSFEIEYLSGQVSGTIVWDTLQIGGYSINNQALAAATEVNSEPLSYDFDGILGLALPYNSIIQNAIGPSVTNDADGSTFASNLFGITPTSQAPAARFLSLSLKRPGSDRTPSLFGIGRHPSELVSDPSKITYSSLITHSGAMRFWQSNVEAITVYVNGQARPVNVGRSITGTAYPVSVVDSGVPYILATSWITSGIYGAIGVNPDSDGKYWVPCTTPLNMTITLLGQPELPLHPLDLTADPQGNPGSGICVGLIQTIDQQEALNMDVGDIILGVPFMRNMYTVLAYDPPNSNGSFPVVPTSDEINPRLGLLSLTNYSTALSEFHTVRVLNQPLSPNPTSTSTTSSRKGLSVGLIVLIALIAFFSLCFILFGVRWALLRRRSSRRESPDLGDPKNDPTLFPMSDLPSSEDTLRALRFDAYMRNKRMPSDYSTDSNLTKVGEHYTGKDDEYGYRSLKDPWEPHTPDWKDNFVGGGAAEIFSKDLRSPGLPDTPSTHHRHLSAGSNGEAPGVTAPLLAHVRSESGSDGEDLAETGAGDASTRGMVGVGTPARGSRIDANFGSGHFSMGSFGSVNSADGDRGISPSPLRPRPTRSPSGPRPPPNPDSRSGGLSRSDSPT